MFVKTPERLRFDKRIRMHISKRQSTTAVSPKKPLKRRDQRALIDTIESAASRVRPVAVLLLGAVGAGKTTFLNYTRKVAAANLFEPQNNQPYPHWIFVDFRELSSDDSSVDFIFSRSRSYINSDDFLSDYERCVRHAYKDQIQALFNVYPRYPAAPGPTSGRLFRVFHLNTLRRLPPHLEKKA